MNINFIHICIYVRERMCTYIYIYNTDTWYPRNEPAPAFDTCPLLPCANATYLSLWKGESIWVRIGWRLRMLNDTARRKHTNRANPSK